MSDIHETPEFNNLAQDFLERMKSEEIYFDIKVVKRFLYAYLGIASHYDDLSRRKVSYGYKLFLNFITQFNEMATKEDHEQNINNN